MSRGTGATAGDPAAPAWRAALAQTVMELRLTARRPENVLVTLVIPVALLVFFVSVPVAPVEALDPVTFLVPGIIALAVISTSLVSLGIATGFERSYGVLKRLGGTPLGPSGLLAAKLAAVVAIEVLQLALVVAVGIVLGWEPPADWQPLVAIGSLLLGTAAFGGLGLALAGTLRAEATLAIANGLFLAFLLLGGVLVPLERLPDPLEVVGRMLPAAALADALRTGLGGRDADPVVALAVLAGWAVAASVVAARAFRWE